MRDNRRYFQLIGTFFIIAFIAFNDGVLSLSLSEKLQGLSLQLVGLKNNLETLKDRLERLKYRLKFNKVSDLNDDELQTESASQWSCLSSQKITSHCIFEVLDVVPTFGVYGPGYPFRNRLSLIEMDPKMLDKAPAKITKSLNDNRIPSSTIYFFTMIAGYKEFAGNTLNMIFHPLLGRNRNWKGGNFNENVLMGLFDINGIQPQDLSVDSLSEISVHYHDRHFSPNNARFTVNTGRNLATFWTVGIPKNPKFIAVTYHLLVNKKDLSDRLEAAFANANHFDEVFDALKQQKTSLDAQDTQALEGFIAELKRIIG